MVSSFFDAWIAFKIRFSAIWWSFSESPFT